MSADREQQNMVAAVALATDELRAAGAARSRGSLDYGPYGWWLGAEWLGSEPLAARAALDPVAATATLLDRGARIVVGRPKGLNGWLRGWYLGEHWLGCSHEPVAALAALRALDALTME